MKVKKIITITVTVITIGMVIMSGIMKLSGGPQVVKMLDAVGRAVQNPAGPCRDYLCGAICRAKNNENRSSIVNRLFWRRYCS